MDESAGDFAVREVVVRACSGRRESLLVAVGVGLILGGVALRVVLLGTPLQALHLRPYQRLDTVLAGSSHYLYQTLLAGVIEVVMLRDREGLWPEAQILTEEAVPPFAGRFLPPPLSSYRWVGYDGGSWVDYVGGDPTAEQAPTFLLRLIDLHAGYHPHPHPGVDYDPERSVAAQVWYYPESGRAYPGERLPEAGWLWLVGSQDPVLLKQSKEAALDSESASTLSPESG